MQSKISKFAPFFDIRSALLNFTARRRDFAAAFSFSAPHRVKFIQTLDLLFGSVGAAVARDYAGQIHHRFKIGLAFHLAHYLLIHRHAEAIDDK